MILKQTCFVISKHELDTLNSNTYVHAQKINKNGNLEDLPTSYTGSSYQRNRPKIYDATSFKSMAKIQTSIDCVQSVTKEKVQKSIEHTLSAKSKIKIRDKLGCWVRANKNNRRVNLFNFITLTLTSKQVGTDKDFTKMLNVFFTYCRKYYNLKNYLYVLERQNRTTNNIHAHIIIDQYVNYERLNSVWCKVLGDNGYTFPQKDYLTGEVKTINCYDALKNYASKDCKNYTGSERYQNPRTGKMIPPTKNLSKPNPCDVQSVHNAKSISIYITKYITKNESLIYTSVWNCSQSISRLWTGAIVNAKIYYAPLREQVGKVLTKTLDNGYVLLVNLLKYYTKIQEDIFSINNKILLAK